MKYKLIYFAISALFIVPGVISLVLFGLKPSIDFTGGSVLELEFKSLEGINSDTITDNALKVEGVEVGSVVNVTGKNNLILKLNTIDESKKNELISTFNNLKPETITDENYITEIRFETVGPSLGRELLYKTFVAIILVSIVILAYIGYQFKDKVYGLAAIIAMFHDSLVLLGIFSILGKFYSIEVDTLFVTAVLTTLSFSVHDTIVVFDRVREMITRHQGSNLEEIIDKALNQTIVRSLNNSMTIIFMLTALAVLGGVTTKWFVTALLIGTVSGTYSSAFVAAPALMYLSKFFRKKTS